MQMATSIEADNGEMIVKRVSVPIGLEELMEGLTKEVILKKPKDICEFASEYFANLLNMREKGVLKVGAGKRIQSVTKQIVTENATKQLNLKSKSVDTGKFLIKQKSIRSESPSNKTLTTKKIVLSSKDNKGEKANDKAKSFLDKRRSRKNSQEEVNNKTQNLSCRQNEKKTARSTESSSSRGKDDSKKTPRRSSRDDTKHAISARSNNKTPREKEAQIRSHLGKVAAVGSSLSSIHTISEDQDASSEPSKTVSLVESMSSKEDLEKSKSLSEDKSKTLKEKIVSGCCMKKEEVVDTTGENYQNIPPNVELIHDDTSKYNIENSIDEADFQKLDNNFNKKLDNLENNDNVSFNGKNVDVTEEKDLENVTADISEPTSGKEQKTSSANDTKERSKKLEATANNTKEEILENSDLQNVALSEALEKQKIEATDLVETYDNKTSSKSITEKNLDNEHVENVTQSQTNEMTAEHNELIKSQSKDSSDDTSAVKSKLSDGILRNQEEIETYNRSNIALSEKDTTNKEELIKNDTDPTNKNEITDDSTVGNISEATSATAVDNKETNKLTTDSEKDKIISETEKISKEANDDNLEAEKSETVSENQENISVTNRFLEEDETETETANKCKADTIDIDTKNVDVIEQNEAEKSVAKADESNDSTHNISEATSENTSNEIKENGNSEILKEAYVSEESDDKSRSTTEPKSSQSNGENKENSNNTLDISQLDSEIKTIINEGALQQQKIQTNLENKNRKENKVSENIRQHENKENMYSNKKETNLLSTASKFAPHETVKQILKTQKPLKSQNTRTKSLDHVKAKEAIENKTKKKIKRAKSVDFNKKESPKTVSNKPDSLLPSSHEQEVTNDKNIDAEKLRSKRSADRTEDNKIQESAFDSNAETLRSERTADTTEDGKIQESTFDSSKLHNEIQEASDLEKTASFSSNYNPCKLKQEIKEASVVGKPEVKLIDIISPLAAAVKIQSTWKGYICRKQVKEMKEKNKDIVTKNVNYVNGILEDSKNTVTNENGILEDSKNTVTNENKETDTIIADKQAQIAKKESAQENDRITPIIDSINSKGDEVSLKATDLEKSEELKSQNNGTSECEDKLSDMSKVPSAENLQKSLSGLEETKELTKAEENEPKIETEKNILTHQKTDDAHFGNESNETEIVEPTYSSTSAQDKENLKENPIKDDLFKEAVNENLSKDNAEIKQQKSPFKQSAINNRDHNNTIDEEISRKLISPLIAESTARLNALEQNNESNVGTEQNNTEVRNDQIFKGKKIVDMADAVLRIQAVYRGFKTRKQLQSEKFFGATVLKEIKQKEEIVKKVDTHKAVSKIQALWRGYKVRKNVKDVSIRLSELQKATECDDMPSQRVLSDTDIFKAATKIQAGVRGYMVRKRKYNACTLNSINEEPISPDEKISEQQVLSSLEKLEDVSCNLPELPLSGDKTKSAESSLIESAEDKTDKLELRDNKLQEDRKSELSNNLQTGNEDAKNTTSMDAKEDNKSTENEVEFIGAELNSSSTNKLSNLETSSLIDGSISNNIVNGEVDPVPSTAQEEPGYEDAPTRPVTSNTTQECSNKQTPEVKLVHQDKIELEQNKQKDNWKSQNQKNVNKSNEINTEIGLENKEHIFASQESTASADSTVTVIHDEPKIQVEDENKIMEKNNLESINKLEENRSKIEENKIVSESQPELESGNGSKIKVQLSSELIEDQSNENITHVENLSEDTNKVNGIKKDDNKTEIFTEQANITESAQSSDNNSKSPNNIQNGSHQVEAIKLIEKIGSESILSEADSAKEANIINIIPDSVVVKSSENNIHGDQNFQQNTNSENSAALSKENQSTTPESLSKEMSDISTTEMTQSDSNKLNIINLQNEILNSAKKLEEMATSSSQEFSSSSLTRDSNIDSSSASPVINLVLEQSNNKLNMSSLETEISNSTKFLSDHNSEELSEREEETKTENSLSNLSEDSKQTEDKSSSKDEESSFVEPTGKELLRVHIPLRELSEIKEEETETKSVTDSVEELDEESRTDKSKSSRRDSADLKEEKDNNISEDNALPKADNIEEELKSTISDNEAAEAEPKIDKKEETDKALADVDQTNILPDSNERKDDKLVEETQDTKDKIDDTHPKEEIVKDEIIENGIETTDKDELDSAEKDDNTKNQNVKMEDQDNKLKEEEKEEATKSDSRNVDEMKLSDNVTDHQVKEENEIEEDALKKDSEELTEQEEKSEIDAKVNQEVTETDKRVSAGASISLGHSGEFHDSITVPITITPPSTAPTAKECQDNNRQQSPQGLVNTGELHDNVLPVSVQLNQAPPAGAQILTSHVSKSINDGQDRAQASNKDASTCETQPDNTKSPTAGMESEKRNNATTIQKKSMEAEAATKIQAGFRGYQVRKQLKNKISSPGDISNQRRSARRKSSGKVSESGRIAKTKPSSDIEEKSAVKIQAGVRGFLVRRRQKKQKQGTQSS